MSIIKVSQKHVEKMVMEAYQNFPEAAISFRCIGWSYGEGNKPFVFDFIDDEDGGKPHVVNFEKAIKGFNIFAELVLTGKLPGLSLGPKWLVDTGDWDGPCFDALAQCAIFGEVIYG